MHYEAIRAHSAVVTCSLFAPVPHLVLEAVERGKEAAGKEGTGKKEQQGQRSTRVSKNLSVDNICTILTSLGLNISATLKLVVSKESGSQQVGK